MTEAELAVLQLLRDSGGPIGPADLTLNEYHTARQLVDRRMVAATGSGYVITDFGRRALTRAEGGTAPVNTPIGSGLRAPAVREIDPPR